MVLTKEIPAVQSLDSLGYIQVSGRNPLPVVFRLAVSAAQNLRVDFGLGCLGIDIRKCRITSTIRICRMLAGVVTLTVGTNTSNRVSH